MIEDSRIGQIRELVARHRANVSKNATPDELDVLLGIDPNDPVQRYANLLVRLASILDSAPPAPRVLGPEHTYALSVARSAVLKAAGKFVAAGDMYRRRDLVRSVQEMADSERACVPDRCGCESGSWVGPCRHTAEAFSICLSWDPVDGCSCPDRVNDHARASEERAIPEPTEGTQP